MTGAKAPVYVSHLGGFTGCLDVEHIKDEAAALGKIGLLRRDVLGCLAIRGVGVVHNGTIATGEARVGLLGSGGSGHHQAEVITAKSKVRVRVQVIRATELLDRLDVGRLWGPVCHPDVSLVGVLCELEGEERSPIFIRSLPPKRGVKHQGRHRTIMVWSRASD